MSKLVCVHGMNKDDEFGLKEGTVLIGRSPECAVVLFDKKCSRKHCQIYKKGNYYAIEDLNSRHGTFVNGKPLTGRQSIKIGDQVSLGKTMLLLSNKPIGSLLDQTATDAAADLQKRGYDKLIGSAAADVLMSKQSHDAEAKRAKGLGASFRRLFTGR